jgi:hypothetical protein
MPYPDCAALKGRGFSRAERYPYHSCHPEGSARERLSTTERSAFLRHLALLISFCPVPRDGQPPDMERIENTVFLSYRHTNAPWALAIFQNLTDHGYDVFFDFSGVASGENSRFRLRWGGNRC